MPGWLVGIAAALGWEAFALKKQKQTLSRAMWNVRDCKWGALLVGAWASLTWHFFVEGRVDVQKKQAV